MNFIDMDYDEIYQCIVEKTMSPFEFVEWCGQSHTNSFDEGYQEASTDYGHN